MRPRVLLSIDKRWSDFETWPWKVFQTWPWQGTLEFIQHPLTWLFERTKRGPAASEQRQRGLKEYKLKAPGRWLRAVCVSSCSGHRSVADLTVVRGLLTRPWFITVIGSVNLTSHGRLMLVMVVNLEELDLSWPCNWWRNSFPIVYR